MVFENTLNFILASFWFFVFKNSKILFKDFFSQKLKKIQKVRLDFLIKIFIFSKIFFKNRNQTTSIFFFVFFMLLRIGTKYVFIIFLIFENKNCLKKL